MNCAHCKKPFTAKAMKHQITIDGLLAFFCGACEHGWWVRRDKIIAKEFKEFCK